MSESDEIDWEQNSYLLEDVKLKSVRLDAVAVMQIVNHCRNDQAATGQLMGIDVEGMLRRLGDQFIIEMFSRCTRTNAHQRTKLTTGIMKVSNSFPMLKTEVETYQQDMVYFLGDMNYDTNVCGFYQSTYLSSFWSQKLIERQYIEQSEFAQSVVILVDSAKLVKGI